MLLHRFQEKSGNGNSSKLTISSCNGCPIFQRCVMVSIHCRDHQTDLPSHRTILSGAEAKDFRQL